VDGVVRSLFNRSYLRGTLTRRVRIGMGTKANSTPCTHHWDLTVVAPLFILQPAMGAGIASSKTPKSVFNCIKSLATHTVFGLGLYLAALATAALIPAALA
jgi:Protein of unknown function (DUF2938)